MNEILSQVTPFLDLDSHSSFNAQQSLPCSSECPFSARDFYGPAYKFCFPQRTPSQSNPQPQVSPVVQSVLDAKSELDIWKALGARTKAILRAKKASPNLSEYEGPLTAWRFQEVNPYAVVFSRFPTNAEIQKCPFFVSGCDCMTGSPPYFPAYYSTNVQGNKYLEYIKNMVYIPSVRPPVPPFSVVLAEEPQSSTVPGSHMPGPIIAFAGPRGSRRDEAAVMIAPTQFNRNTSGSSYTSSSIPRLPQPPTAPALSRPVYQKQKRALEADDSPEPAETNQSNSKRKKSAQSVQDNEKALIARYVQEEIDKNNYAESKWQNVADKLLKDHSISRSGNSVKAFWSRYGREEFGIDERKNPDGRNLVTSKQDPEERRKARERKKREAAEGYSSNTHE